MITNTDRALDMHENVKTYFEFEAEISPNNFEIFMGTV